MTQFKDKTITIFRFPNVQNETPRDDRKERILKKLVISGFTSVIMFLIIYYTLPKTLLSKSGLVVYASVLVLVLFLTVLLIRYFGALIASFIYFFKNSGSKENNFHPFVSIIIPAYNEGKVLENSVKSLVQLNYENYEIIIVNDGSSDDTRSVAEDLVGFHKGKSADIKVSLINKPNGGKASALNFGAQYSQADYVLCMDADSELSPDTLKIGMKHFIDPEVGAVAGNVKVLNRNKALPMLQALEYVEGLNMHRSAQALLGMINIIPGPLGIFRKKAIQEAGWYSNDTFAEDADLTLKLRFAGWKIRYEMDAISYTEAPESLYQLLKQRYRWTRGFLQSIRKHKKYLFNPFSDPVNTLVLWSMFFEGIIFPTMSIFTNLFFILVAVIYGLANIIPLWWTSIALLDIMSALYCVAVEKEEFRLIPYALLYRIFFIFTVDVTKAAATIEEFLGIEMSWGKLERVGKLAA